MRKLPLLVLLAAGLALAGGGARAGGGATIELRAAAELRGTTYTLGDIAEIEAGTASLGRRLAAIPVGVVPRQGYAESVSREQIEARVRQHVSLAGIHWRGAAQTRIRGRGQRLDSGALVEAAAGALRPALARDFEAIEVEPLAGFEGVDVPAGTVRLRARVPAGQRVSRRMSALVDVSVDDRQYTTLPVWFSVKASRRALVARVALRAGAPVRADDFDARTVDLAESTGSALAVDAPLEGMRLRRGLDPGAVLSAENVEPRPDVARDEKVTVRVVQGTVTIETFGRAMSDARVGERVEVRSANSKALYTARVVGEGVVLVGGR